MMYTKQLVHDKMLGSNDVGVSIMWKHFLRVARLTGVSMPDRIRQDNKELTNIKGLSCSKQKVGSVGLKELCAATGRSMEKENGVVPRRVERGSDSATSASSIPHSQSGIEVLASHALARIASSQSSSSLPVAGLVERQTLNTSSRFKRFHDLSLSQVNDGDGAIVLVCN